MIEVPLEGSVASGSCPCPLITSFGDFSSIKRHVFGEMFQKSQQDLKQGQSIVQAIRFPHTHLADHTYFKMKNSSLEKNQIIIAFFSGHSQLSALR